MIFLFLNLLLCSVGKTQVSSICIRRLTPTNMFSAAIFVQNMAGCKVAKFVG